MMTNQKKVITFKSFTVFLKAQISSILATALDWTVTLGLVNIFSMWYVYATTIGSILGGITNFALNRRWVFEARHGRKSEQFPKYVLIWCGSIGLNISGTILLTELVHLHYLISKIATAIIVAISFNFYLQKAFVFKVPTKTSL